MLIFKMKTIELNKRLSMDAAQQLMNPLKSFKHAWLCNANNNLDA